MATVVEQISDMVCMLPEEEQSLAFELVKRLVLAWDPDFTKVTPAEAERLALADEELKRGEFEDLQM
jgi:hypothetical protein